MTLHLRERVKGRGEDWERTERRQERTERMQERKEEKAGEERGGGRREEGCVGEGRQERRRQRESIPAHLALVPAFFDLPE